MINFDKSEIHSISDLKYIKFLVDRKVKNKTILISHGSAGIGQPEFSLLEVAISKNFDVIMIDHFTHRGISSQWWHQIETNPSLYDRMNDILSVAGREEISALAGISAGGTGVLMASSSLQIKSFSIYPSTYPITKSMATAYQSTIIVGDQDNWTTPKHAKILSQINNAKLVIVNGHHGFLKHGPFRNLAECVSFRNIVDSNIYSDNYIPASPVDIGVTVEFSETAYNKTIEEFILFLDTL
jgi:hypothetical protein